MVETTGDRETCMTGVLVLSHHTLTGLVGLGLNVYH